MRLFVFVVIFFAFVADVVAQTPDETPATPKRKDAPTYPAACLEVDRKAGDPEFVTIVYTINRYGLTERVRVRESTDECFEEAALSAVRGWVFEPKTMNDRAVALEDQEITFTFVLNAPTQTRDFDARPIVRAPPSYPSHCERRAKQNESVLLEFDVNELGETENIEVIESTNDCFNGVAARSVENWKYRPKLIDGKPAVRENVQTQLRFQLAGRGRPEPEDRVRKPLARKLLRVQRKLNRDAEIEVIISDLAAIEAEYAASFTPVELQAFHQLRARARVVSGDYRGALDDYRVVKRFPMRGELAEYIDLMIAALERDIAKSEREAESSSEAAQGEEAPAEEAAPSD